MGKVLFSNIEIGNVELQYDLRDKPNPPTDRYYPPEQEPVNKRYEVKVTITIVSSGKMTEEEFNKAIYEKLIIK